jgi:hypothetical protein
METPKFIQNQNKSQEIVGLINEAVFVLSKLGIPVLELSTRQLEKMGMAFLAVADIKRSKDWSKARVREADTLKSRDIITYVNENFAENISKGSYDDIRRKDLNLPVVAGIIMASANKPGAAHNDPTRGYSLSPEYLDIIRCFSKKTWVEQVEKFMSGRVALNEKLAQHREINQMPVKLPNGIIYNFGPGKHNLLQKAVVEEFLPKYGYGAEVLYIGDASKKHLVQNETKLKELRFMELEHGKLPDIVAYSELKNWIFLIEAVYSSGPVSPVRLEELKRLTKECTADIIYVSAFLNRETFRKFTKEIAWETEVWIAESPEHLVHFNGDKFLGPYKEMDR